MSDERMSHDLALLGAWETGAVLSAHAPATGTINRTLLIETTSGGFVLRCYRHAERTPVEREHAAIAFARDRGIPAVAPVALPNGEAWLASVERVDEKLRHLSVHRGHSFDISNGHDALVDVSAAKQMTFTGTREELRERLVQLEAAGATGVIFGTSGYDVERELRAYAEVAGLR